MNTKLFLAKESYNNEQRVALIPSDVARLINCGAAVYVEDAAGLHAGYSNEDYAAVGAHIRILEDKIDSYQQALGNIDIIVRVKRPNRRREKMENKVIQPYVKMVGLLDILEQGALHIKEYEHAKIDYYSLDQFIFPSGTEMDALKEMSRIAGRLALEHALETAQSKVTHVSIVGGSQAGIAAAKECVKQGLPHTIITSKPSKAQDFLSQGIPSEVVERHLPLERRQEKIYQIIKNSEVIITTASMAWDLAPLLIPKSTLKKLKQGTVIIDLATSDGGNVFGSKHDKTITFANQVKVINVSGYPKKLPVEASKFLSKAYYHFLHLLLTSHKTLMSFKNRH